MAKEVKKDIKATEARPTMKFAFGPKNYIFLLLGVALLIIGYITLSGGGSTNPNVFTGDQLFSTRRMVVAPIILILGYGIVAYAIMIRESNEEETEQ